MRAYFRTAPRLWPPSLRWLALPVVVLWGALAVFFWMCAGVWIVARFTTQQAQRGWRAWQARGAA